MNAPSILPVRCAQRSFAGRRDYNEDAVAVAASGASYCAVLSDGAGGHQGGAEASRIAVEHVLLGFHARVPADPPDLAELLLDAHDAVLRAQHGKTATRAMHATVVVLLVDLGRGRVFWGHVGDSRLYRLRGGRVIEVTRDDTVIAYMMESGMLSAHEAHDHPRKNQLLAALGVEGDLTPTVSGVYTDLQDGDAYLLCSDGWWSALQQDDIERSLGQAASVDAWLDAMAALVEARGDPKQDNFSAVGLWIGDPGERTRIVPRTPG